VGVGNGFVGATVGLICGLVHSLLLYGGCNFDDDGCCNTTSDHVCRSVQAEIFSVVSDRDGITLFMDPNGIDMFHKAVRSGRVAFASRMVWADSDVHWGVEHGRYGHHCAAGVARDSGALLRAFPAFTLLPTNNSNRECGKVQIHLGPMVAEFPGVISFLSKLLAEDDISILNMSTYDTDIIYVQVGIYDLV
jgi:hypothetical protein